MGDFGPVYSDQDSMYASLNVWIRSADDWEQTGRPSSYRKKYRGKKYNKSKDYKNKNNKDNDYKDDKDNYDNDDSSYKKNDRKKPSYSRVKFPVRQYKDIKKFPHSNTPEFNLLFQSYSPFSSLLH